MTIAVSVIVTTKIWKCPQKKRKKLNKVKISMFSWLLYDFFNSPWNDLLVERHLTLSLYFCQLCFFVFCAGICYDSKGGKLGNYSFIAPRRTLNNVVSLIVFPLLS